ncbi:molybdopterin synthase sulfur carrier subunit [Agaricicola taiwanensis]|uniref:Molybdopterin synthase sulfur carrier subunit n=1 Tax=Agaricicola taiwanensis TaxID=591372 RepID=A0A8J2YH37_9RHOB|nr:molybdopterin converting factor subunit 1 [Agaricicola taiwanensis]GGE40301.1 molybdopterin synthase sulfur carrier subunit [Agaricicola taiwanensis]
MKLVYFAWVRERIGRPGEELDLPDDLVTVADLIGWLSERGDEYAHAFKRPEVIRTALDKRHAPHDAPLAGATEVAFFPPMTGG